MTNPSQPEHPDPPNLRRNRQWRRGASIADDPSRSDALSTSIFVGLQLRELRAERGISIRSLADQSGLNVNTLSLIENGKSSPSVGTLQQLASALDVPITAFFERKEVKNDISYLKAGQRRRVAFHHGTLEDLGTGLTLRGGQPFLVTMEPKADSGPIPIVHTGHEFVFCLEGQLTYTISGNLYSLDPGDSLLFAAHLPHCWCNTGKTPSRSLLIMCPTDEDDHPTERHFKPE
ncbi:MAG TPA: cupin domain-containing protein [Anaerolineales bacterium]|nr:cupin domain-containing protein [Anaerolineales bacterium]